MAFSYDKIRSRLDALAARKMPDAAAPVPEPPRPEMPALPAEAIAAALPGVRLLEGEHGNTLLQVHRWGNSESGIRIPNYADPDGCVQFPAELESSMAGPCDPVPTEALPLLCPELPGDASPPATERICFLDTETTGLAGAAGTVAFMVGIAWWERSAAGHWGFALEQYVITDFCHETDLLERLAARLAGFDMVCHYNGRSYDMPLLRARAVMNRVSPRPFALPQADLLPCARRLWAGLLPSVSLKSVEKEVLGINRGGDIPGAEIPEVFFNLARSGDPGRLAEVLRHNAQDLVSLAGLLALVGRALQAPPASGPLRRPAELAGLARWREAQRRWEDAGEAWRLAAAAESGPADQARLLLREAAARKRQRDWEAASRLWRHLEDRAAIPVAFAAAVELAKYQEHVLKDCDGALETVRRTQRRLALREELAAWQALAPEPANDSVREDLERRATRLRKRAARRWQAQSIAAAR